MGHMQGQCMHGPHARTVHMWATCKGSAHMGHVQGQCAHGPHARSVHAWAMCKGGREKIRILC